MMFWNWFGFAQFVSKWLENLPSKYSPVPYIPEAEGIQHTLFAIYSLD